MSSQRLARFRPEPSHFIWMAQHITGMRNSATRRQPDALEEFRVETNAFAAQYGQFSGAVVTVITKSGKISSWRIVRVQPQHRFNAFGWNPSNNPLRTLVKALTTATTWRDFGVPSSTTRPSSSSAMPVARGARRNGLRRCDAHGCRAHGRLYRGPFKVYNRSRPA